MQQENAKKKRKNLDLSKECIKIFTKLAADLNSQGSDTSCKQLMEEALENAALNIKRAEQSKTETDEK